MNTVILQWIKKISLLLYFFYFTALLIGYPDIDTRNSEKETINHLNSAPQIVYHWGNGFIQKYWILFQARDALEEPLLKGETKPKNIFRQLNRTLNQEGLFLAFSLFWCFLLGIALLTHQLPYAFLSTLSNLLLIFSSSYALAAFLMRYSTQSLHFSPLLSPRFWFEWVLLGISLLAFIGTAVGFVRKQIGRLSCWSVTPLSVFIGAVISFVQKRRKLKNSNTSTAASKDEWVLLGINLLPFIGTAVDFFRKRRKLKNSNASITASKDTFVFQGNSLFVFRDLPRLLPIALHFLLIALFSIFLANFFLLPLYALQLTWPTVFAGVLLSMIFFVFIYYTISYWQMIKAYANGAGLASALALLAYRLLQNVIFFTCVLFILIVVFSVIILLITQNIKMLNLAV